jgi:ribose-phosphate pyrophosphokinase
MSRQLFIFPGNESLGEKLLESPVFQRGDMNLRRFPDGESYVRILSDVKEQDVVLLCTLHQPDEKIMPIYFLSNLARRLGARSVTLIAPYLAYMRQDKAFHPGEAVTSDAFARLLSGWIDELITIDPHLHRHHRMSEIYSIPARVLHAEPLIAGYIRDHIARPVIIGPDAESEQWVSDIARRANCSFQILKKERLGDRRVRISLPYPELLQGRTPVLADDIISTGQTMIETVKHLQEPGAPPPVCIGVHGVFANNAWEELKKSGVRDIVTTNTIPHPSNGMDVSGLILGFWKKANSL